MDIVNHDFFAFINISNELNASPGHHLAAHRRGLDLENSVSNATMAGVVDVVQYAAESREPHFGGKQYYTKRTAAATSPTAPTSTVDLDVTIRALRKHAKGSRTKWGKTQRQTKKKVK